MNLRRENSASRKSPGSTKPRRKSPSEAQAGLRAEEKDNCSRVTAGLLPTLGYSEQIKDGKWIKQHHTISRAAQTGGTEVVLTSLVGCPVHPGTMVSRPGRAPGDAFLLLQGPVEEKRPCLLPG